MTTTDRVKILPIKAEDREYAKKYIGATSVPVLYLEEHPYDSPYSLWLHKTGRVPEKDLSEVDAVNWGNLLEDPIAKMFMLKNPNLFDQIERVEELFVLTEAEYCACHIDYTARRIEDNKTVLIEVKNSEMGMKKWKPEPPDHYFLQCQWEMYVTGYDECYLVAKVGHSLVQHLIKADPEIQAKMRELVDKFWHENIEQDVCPELRWSDADRIREEMGEINSDIIERRDDLIDAITAYVSDQQIWQEAKQYNEKCEQARKLADAMILNVIKDSHARVTMIGQASITRWNQQTTTVDSDKLKKLYPQVYEDVVRKTVSGRYRINTAKVITLGGK